jgi:hypothetical protein
MRRRSVVEELSGVGRIFIEGQSTPALEGVEYEITIWQEWIETRSHSGTGELAGLKVIEGSLSKAPYKLIGESIELQLADNRRWKCFIQSSNGNLVNRGGIK